MPHTLPLPTSAQQSKQLSDVRPVPAKASLTPQVRTSSLRELTAEAIRRTSGKARAAAIDLNIHEAHLSRQLKDGTLRIEQIERLGPELAVALGRLLVETYGPLSASPAARLRMKATELHALAVELESLADYITEAV